MSYYNQIIKKIQPNEEINKLFIIFNQQSYL